MADHSPYDAKQLPINTAASGDTLLVAGVAGKFIRVLGYTMISGGIVNATWKSGANAKSGPLPLIANVGASPASNPRGVLLCGIGENLILNLDQAIQVSGHFTYEMVG